jgi:hypothetical protein
LKPPLVGKYYQGGRFLSNNPTEAIIGNASLAKDWGQRQCHGTLQQSGKWMRATVHPSILLIEAVLQIRLGSNKMKFFI